MNSNIEIAGKPLLSPQTEISAHGKLHIGNGVITERGAFLAVRKNASLHLGCKVYINRNACVVARESIMLGDYVDIGPNVCIYDHDHNREAVNGFVTAPIAIGDNVWIGANSTILKGVNIGKNSTIAAGCVITHDVPDNSLVYQKRNTTVIERRRI